jgi:hypothetical protein
MPAGAKSPGRFEGVGTTMRGWASLAIAGGLALFAAVSPASAQSRAQFIERFLGESLERLTGTGPNKPAARPKAVQPAHAPLLSVPLPRLRPDTAALGFLPDATSATVAVPIEEMARPVSEEPAHVEDSGVETGGIAVPMPRLRARVAAATAAALADIPPNADAPPLVPLSELVEPPPAAQSTCGISLAMLGVSAAPLEEVDGSGACGMDAPVEVASLSGGGIDLSGETIIECRLAETFARWMDETVNPIAATMLNGKVTGLRVAASYACRGRNNVEGAKLSEHGKGNAIDISAFEIDGKWLAVGKTAGVEQEFVQAVRHSACGPFKTVLGPGSDAYHSDHLHLDLAERRNGGTYCR